MREHECKLVSHCKCERQVCYVIRLIVMFCAITVVLDVALCNLVDMYQGFRRTCA